MLVTDLLGGCAFGPGLCGPAQRVALTGMVSRDEPHAQQRAEHRGDLRPGAAALAEVQGKRRGIERCGGIGECGHDGGGGVRHAADEDARGWGGESGGVAGRATRAW